jgi:hypothetical protein
MRQLTTLKQGLGETAVLLFGCQHRWTMWANDSFPVNEVAGRLSENRGPKQSAGESQVTQKNLLSGGQPETESVD